MVNKSLSYYCLSKTLSQLVFDSKLLISEIYSDKIFELKNPKSIIDLTVSDVNSNNSIVKINSSYTDFNSNNSSINLLNKSDKKYKNNTSTEHVIDNKKSKSKISKKNRKQITLDQDDTFIKNNEKFFDDQNSTISSPKSHKFNKNKSNSKPFSVTYLDELSNNSNTNTQKQINNISKDIVINIPLSIQELSYKLNIPEAEIITYLFLKGIATTINQVIDVSIAREVALKYDFRILNDEDINQVKINSVNKVENLSEYVTRSPIVTIFGHVDHGKTTLLDYILKTNFANEEYGGITQAIAGYEIDWLYNSNLFKLVFLDTPGHEAFTTMRLRGAKVTDIALLVIAADDGLRPQTIESIKYILDMQLSYIVVINKIDKKDIDVVRIKEELSKYNILSKEWGGDSLIIEVSAITGKNMELLLSNICLLANKQSFTANPNQCAEGTILESNLDKQKGVISHIIIQNGTLKIGDIIIAGNVYAKVKSIINANNIKIQLSGPSSIVQVLGFSKVPESGILFNVVNNEKQAKQYIQEFSNSHQNLNRALKSLNKRVTLDNQHKLKQLNLIIKTDTLGSLEAILASFSKISQKKVQINIIAANSGNISSTDIELALTTNSTLVGFNIDITNYLNNLVKKNNLILKDFNVIYNLLDYIENCMMDLIEPEYKRVFIGRATVQTVFSMNKGSVAGCLVNDGKLQKMSFIIVYRDNNIVYEGILNSLKRLKDDVEEVFAINECGLMCDYHLWQNSDIIESYNLIPEDKSL